MKTILVTGANGQLGNSIRRLAAGYPQYAFVFTDVDTLCLLYTSVFAVGGEADGTNACAIEDIAQSVTLLWIGCRRDNGFAVRLEVDFRNVVRFVRGCKIFDYD